MFYPRDAGGGRNHSSVNDATLQANIKKMLQAETLDDVHKQNFELQKYTSHEDVLRADDHAGGVRGTRAEAQGRREHDGARRPTRLARRSTLHTWISA